MNDNLEWQWQQENARLRAALLFYAKPINYSASFGFYSGVRKISQVEYDGGKVARKALEEFSGGNYRNHASGE